MCIKKLREEDIDVTGFWYNTNIHPYMEYRARRDTLKKYSEIINLDVIYKDEYGLREFTKNTINILDNRCRYCIIQDLMKLQDTQKKMVMMHFAQAFL